MGINLMDIEKDVLYDLRNNGSQIVPPNLLSSTRAVGDAVQEYLATRGLASVLKKYGISVKSNFSRRAIEDAAFNDDGKYYAVDVKTHNLQANFSRPNLISVKRLAEFYKNPNNNFCVLIVSYTVSDNMIDYKECHFNLIESFSWDCLAFGALGCGQIQIANPNNLSFNNDIDRKIWMVELCDKLEAFYDCEIKKIENRKEWFRHEKERLVLNNK